MMEWAPELGLVRESVTESEQVSAKEMDSEKSTKSPEFFLHTMSTLETTGQEVHTKAGPAFHSWMLARNVGLSYPATSDDNVIVIKDSSLPRSDRALRLIESDNNVIFAFRLNDRCGCFVPMPDFYANSHRLCRARK